MGSANLFFYAGIHDEDYGQSTLTLLTCLNHGSDDLHNFFLQYIVSVK